MPILKMTDVNLKDQRVLIREDFNVPIEQGRITSDTRIRAALPTIEYALNAGAKVILMSHLDRPKEGEFQPQFSLKPVAECLTKLLNKPVKFISDWSTDIDLKNGEIALCENVRFLKGEKQNDPVLAKKMAALCDIFVMDAFATAHRAEASTVGVAEYAPIACAGLLLTKELEALQNVLASSRRTPQEVGPGSSRPDSQEAEVGSSRHSSAGEKAEPLIAIIGGSKVSTKLTVLNNLLDKVNQLIVGGGIANTFLAAQGYSIGKSLYEPELIDTAKKLLAKAQQNHQEILLPNDVVVATEFSAAAKPIVKDISKVENNEMILDIGPKTAQRYAVALQKAGTILWNGPVGVFEFEAFSQGTKNLALAIAESPAFSVAGGGDTLAAIEKFSIADKISYISTAGGAFLEFIEGKTLPAIKILEERNKTC